MFSLIRKKLLPQLLLFAVIQISNAQMTSAQFTVHPKELRLLKAGTVDPFCTVSNTVGDTCYISGLGSKRMYSDLYYETSLSLVFNDTQLYCIAVGTGFPCSIYFKFNQTSPYGGLTLANSSSITGRQVIIEGKKIQVNILDTSSIDVSGQSFNTNGTQKGAGASFLGQGGYCGNSNLTNSSLPYSYFNMVPAAADLTFAGSQYGSMGMKGDAETAGGGRIVIVVDSLNLYGTGTPINAKGLQSRNNTNLTYPLQGGSGGYMYISTHNLQVTENIISSDVILSADGGFGFGGFFGGSGGVIVFDGNFTINENQVSAAGGQAINSTLNMDGCGNGAAGSIWYRSTDRLVINNKGTQTQSLTFIWPSTPEGLWSISNPPVITKDVALIGGANVQIQGPHYVLKFEDFFMDGLSVLAIENDMPQFTMYLTKNVVVQEGSTFDFSQCDKFIINATSHNNTVLLGNVWFKRIFTVISNNIVLNGNILAWNSNTTASSYVTLISDSLLLNSTAYIASHYLLLQANNLLKSNPGAQITSLVKNTCNVQSQNSNLFQCVPFDSQQSNVTSSSFISNFNSVYKTSYNTQLQIIPSLLNNYTVYIYSFGEINLDGTTIQAPKIGVCANNITLIGSTLDTSGKGCISDQGLGKGSGRLICAGSGGAHGGKGGWGTAYDEADKDQCQSYFTRPYVQGRESLYEGSGGGSGTRNGGLGGSGGGIILLSTPGSINLKSSSLLARGSPGISAFNDTTGSGGGAGGSIQIISNSLSGDGEIDITGGRGSLGGGGGGSGGRLVNHYLQSFMSDKMMQMSYNWNGTFKLVGGQSYINELNYNQTQQNGFGKSDQGSNTTNASLSVDVPDIFIPTTTDTTNSTDDSQWENSTAIVVTPQNQTNATNGTKPGQKPKPYPNPKPNPNNKPGKKAQSSLIADMNEFYDSREIGKIAEKISVNNNPRRPVKPFAPIQNKTAAESTWTKIVLPANVDGSNGEDGTTLSVACFGGFSGPFCQPCEVGTYKFNFGYGICKPCSNKPMNSYYIKNAQNTPQCSYQCDDGFESSESNIKCYNTLNLQVQKLGGPLTALILFGTFFTICFIIWLLLIVQSKAAQVRIGNKNKSLYDEIMFQTTDDDEEGSENIIGRGNLQMKDADIWSHTYRMYLIGDNSIHYPWYISKDFPANCLSESTKEKFLNFIDRDQWTIDWTGIQRAVYRFSRIVMPYVSEEIQRAFRRKHFSQLGDSLYKTFEEGFWSEKSGDTFRLSADSQGYQLSYIDFLDFRKTKSNYKGPQLPITLLLAGNGSFDTPYYLNFQEDSLAKSLVYLNKEVLKTKLPIFFENFNTLLAKLSFFKFNRITMRDLNEIIDWVELGNKSLFYTLDVKATLYVFENSYSETDNGSFKQKRRSLPLDPLVFESFQELYKDLIRFVQSRLLSHQSEIRIGLVFKPFDHNHKRQLNERIKKTRQQKAEQSDSFAHPSTFSASALLFSNEGENLERTRINSSFTNEESLLPGESQMQESQVFVGDETRTLKIIDKSKRAFDISSNSTKAFELTLQDQSSDCGMRCGRLQSMIFSLWLLMMKHHGKPPGQKGLYCLFLTFAALLSIDIMLSFIIYIDVFNPIGNVWSFGIPWLFVLPGITLVAPFWGIFACFGGSSRMLKIYSSMNATIFLVNYPLTFFYMLYMRLQAFYICTIVALMLNKIFINFVSAKVRQHLINPNYSKNEAKLDKRHRNMVTARVDIVTRDVSHAERAALLVASGPPSESLRNSFAGHSDDDDRLSDDYEGQDYGIISKAKV